MTKEDAQIDALNKQIIQMYKTQVDTVTAMYRDLLNDYRRLYETVYGKEKK